MAEIDNRNSVDDESEVDEHEIVLKVENLVKIYQDDTVAVDDVSFNVRKGDFCVLIGPSGCGKSTTLHSIVGKFEPTSGQIFLSGEDITDTAPHNQDIGLVFQDFQLFPHLTVDENIRYGLERMGQSTSEIQEQVGDIVELMQLEDIQDRSPTELSSGQQQRVALARSLVLEPELLLLDEPLGDLDYKLQKSLEREFLRLHAELDTTFIYVTHDQTQAMRLGDQIIVMNGGKIEQSGSVDEVYNMPATAFVATFVGDTNVFFGELVDITPDHDRATVETRAGKFTVNTANLRSSPEELIGNELVFAVRPQFLNLDSEMPNTIECHVEDVIYRPGRGTQVVLTSANSTDKARQLQLRAYDKIKPTEETVTIGWHTKHTILLEEISVVGDIDLENDILGE